MRLAIVTNIITPYRRNFYEEINKVLQREGGELRVFVMTDSLPLRPWTYEDLKSTYTELLPVKKFFVTLLIFPLIRGSGLLTLIRLLLLVRGLIPHYG